MMICNNNNNSNNNNNNNNKFGKRVRNYAIFKRSIFISNIVIYPIIFSQLYFNVNIYLILEISSIGYQEFGQYVK